MTVNTPSNIVFSGSDSSSAPINVAGGTLTVSGGTLAGNAATTVSGGVLALGNGVISGGTTTVAAGGTLAGSGTITAPTVVNGSISPSLGGQGLNFGGAGNLTLNGGSTFVLQGSGGTVGVVQGVSTLSFGTAAVNLQAVPLDGSTTFNGSSTYTFLTYASGPSPGVQTNWNVGGASTITWSGSGDMVHWDNAANWSGANASGGTVTAVLISGSGALQVSGLSVVANGPQTGSSVVISSSAGATVTGPAGIASVLGLTLGSAGGGPNTLNLSTGTLSVTGGAGTTVNATGMLIVDGNNISTFQTTSLSVAGTTSVINGGTLLVSGAVKVSNPGMLNVDNTSSFQAGSLVVSGGSVTLNNINAGTLTAATLSAGTTTLGSPTTVTAANISGSAVVNINAGSVSTLTASGGNRWSGAGSGNQCDRLCWPANPQQYQCAGQSGRHRRHGQYAGWRNGRHCRLQPFGAAAVTTGGALAITGQLKVNGGLSAAISNGNSFAYTPSGGSLNTVRAGWHAGPFRRRVDNYAHRCRHPRRRGQCFRGRKPLWINVHGIARSLWRGAGSGNHLELACRWHDRYRPQGLVWRDYGCDLSCQPKSNGFL